MKLKEFVKSVFGKSDIFDIPKDELTAERARVQYRIEDLTADQEAIEAKVQRIMYDSRGKSKLSKMMGAETIKALKQEQKVLVERGQRMLQLYRTLNLLHAVHMRREEFEDSPILSKLTEADTSQLQSILEDENIEKRILEGRLDTLESALSSGFKPSVDATDPETEEILRTMDELEALDEDAAVEVAREKARSVSDDAAEKIERDAIFS